MNVRYSQFKKVLAPFLCFSVQDARKHFLNFDNKRLSEWQKKGYLQKIIRSYYIFADTPKDTPLWWYVANCIFAPSYVSLQSALNYYGFIPEAVFHVTSVTTKRTRDLNSTDVSFIYKNIKTSCYFGYTLMLFQGHFIRVAEPEKALLDLIYLDASIGNEVSFEAWRFNKAAILQTVSMPLMEEYALLMQNQSFSNRFLKFKIWLYA